MDRKQYIYKTYIILWRITAFKIQPSNNTVFSIKAGAKTWLTRILINECCHILRKRERFTAPSRVSFTLHWNVYNEEAFAILRTTTFFWEDSSGTRYAPDELHMNSFCSPETRNPETGWIEFEQIFEIRNLDSTSEFIKIIPFEGGFDENGAYIEGTETPREDMGFAVQF